MDETLAVGLNMTDGFRLSKTVIIQVPQAFGVGDDYPVWRRIDTAKGIPSTSTPPFTPLAKSGFSMRP